MSLKGPRFALGVVLVLGWLAWPLAAGAEKVTANQATKVYSRAGEQSAVITKVKAGQELTLLTRDGRWLKVRVSGRTGWIPRSMVDIEDDDEGIARNTRRRPFVDGRSTKRGFGGQSGPEDRVGADATEDRDEPRITDGDDPDDAGDDAGDDDDGDEKPARKPAKRTAAADDDDDGDEKPARKPAKRTAAADDDDDGDEKPARKPAKRTAAADDDEDADADADEKPARSRKASDDDEEARPRARVAKRTAVRLDAEKDSEEAFTADPKTALYVVREDGGWTYVENARGERGWVQTSKLEIEERGAGGRTRMIDARARLGVAMIKQSVSTTGGMNTLPDNYDASSSSVTVALGGSVLYPYSKRYWLGGELAYDYDNAVLGGISYQGRTTTFAFHNFNLRAVAGYDLRKASGMIVFGRLGYHYDSFQVADVNDPTKNTAKLPSQIVRGPVIGTAVTLPRLTQTFGLRVSLDAMLFGGSMQQTKGLEDGVGPKPKAYYLGGVGTYRWKPKMDLQGTYDLAYTSVGFAGPAPAESMRGHTAGTTSATTSLNHTFSVGIAYAF
jgi:SH3-like domain-containing protein